jgi:hypothetical protein
VPLKVDIRDGIVILDMKQMCLGQAKEMQMEMEITGVPSELPGDLQPGKKLKDAEVTMTVNMVFMKMKTVIKMTGGECVAIEDVTVPAGTFKCYKVTQTVSTTVMNKDVVTRTISWYAPGIGVVKTESYNKNQLQSSMELVEMN